MSSVTTTYTSQLSNLKIYYERNVFSAYMSEQCPFVGHLMQTNKRDWGNNEGGGERHFAINMSMNGTGGDFASARANQIATSAEVFKASPAKLYGTCTLDGMLLKMTRGEKSAFIQHARDSFDSTMKGLRHDLRLMAIEGQMNTVSSVTTGSTQAGASPAAQTFTIVVPRSTILRFYTGMNLNAFNEAGPTQRTLPLDARVVGIDASTGTLTLSGVWTGNCNWAAGDALYQNGKRAKGFLGWNDFIPKSTAGLGTPFLGVTRNKDIERLAGHRETFAAGTPIVDRIDMIGGRLAAYGASAADKYICKMHTSQYRILKSNLVAQSEPRMNYSVYAPTGPRSDGQPGDFVKVGYSGITIDGALPVTVYPDPFMPVDEFFMIALNSWELCSSMGSFEFDAADLEASREQLENEDAFQYRSSHYGNIICKAPGKNGRGSLDAPINQSV